MTSGRGTRPCAWCDKDFQPSNNRQQCCCQSHAALLRQAQRRTAPDYQPPQPSNWRQHPTTTMQRGLAGDHVRLKKQLTPQAVGTVCPFYGIDPKCPGIMLDGQRLALDHIIARALGGATTIDNVRIAHYDCNLRAGGRLGNQLSRRHPATYRSPGPLDRSKAKQDALW